MVITCKLFQLYIALPIILNWLSSQVPLITEVKGLSRPRFPDQAVGDVCNSDYENKSFISPDGVGHEIVKDLQSFLNDKN